MVYLQCGDERRFVTACGGRFPSSYWSGSLLSAQLSTDRNGEILWLPVRHSLDEVDEGLIDDGFKHIRYKLLIASKDILTIWHVLLSVCKATQSMRSDLNCYFFLLLNHIALGAISVIFLLILLWVEEIYHANIQAEMCNSDSSHLISHCKHWLGLLIRNICISCWKDMVDVLMPSE